jgi:hypothetical protein
LSKTGGYTLCLDWESSRAVLLGQGGRRGRNEFPDRCFVQVRGRKRILARGGIDVFRKRGYK